MVSQEYTDEDGNGLPLGLENIITAISVGEGELIVSLRHMPEEDGQLVKNGDLLDQFCTDGEGGLPGAWDFQITFPLSVTE